MYGDHMPNIFIKINMKIIPPFNLARWGMRQAADRFEDKTLSVAKKPNLVDLKDSKDELHDDDLNTSQPSDTAATSLPNSRPATSDVKYSVTSNIGVTPPSTSHTRRNSKDLLDPNSPIAIERRLIANSMVVDIFADPFVAQLERYVLHVFFLCFIFIYMLFYDFLKHILSLAFSRFLTYNRLIVIILTSCNHKFI
jgi:hypothetical protein